MNASAEADAERFDEILAAMIGLAVPGKFAGEDEILSEPRESYAAEAARAARLEAQLGQAETSREAEEGLSTEERWVRQVEREALCAEAEDDARCEARWQWDSWHAGICEAVDAVLEGAAAEAEAECCNDPAEPPRTVSDAVAAAASRGDADFSLRTVSTVSTPGHPAASPETNEVGPEDGLPLESGRADGQP